MRQALLRVAGKQRSQISRRVKPLIIAHRGARAVQPENTVAAMEAAIEMGADMVEFDVRRLRDGTLVVNHGAFKRGLPLRIFSYSELEQSASLARPRRRQAPPPLFDELLEACAGRVKLDIEIKERGFENEVIERTLAKVERDQFIVTSFVPSVVSNVKQRDGDIKTGLLVNYWNRRSVMVERLRACRADYLCPKDILVTLASRTEFPLLVWTANRMARINRLLANPSVHGIITDLPDRAVSLRALAVPPSAI